jgi:hypothetical protein
MRDDMTMHKRKRTSKSNRVIYLGRYINPLHLDDGELAFKVTSCFINSELKQLGFNFSLNDCLASLFKFDVIFAPFFPP